MNIQVVLNLSKLSNAQVLVDADHYATSIVGNPYFTSEAMADDIKKLQASIVAFRNELNAPLSETKKDKVLNARDVLDRTLKMVKADVEIRANAPDLSDAERVTIVHSAGMTVKTQIHPQSRVFSVKAGDISGSVLLYAQGGAVAHEWQYTNDIVNFSNRIPLPTTTTAKTEIDGLSPKTEYAFFHKPVVAGEKTEWENPILFMVK